MAADINAMLDRLGSTISGLERFMSEVSHELKTPVSALLAEAQVMKYAPPTAETAGRFILSVEDEMRRLGKLVESFLMLARFEHGRRYIAEAAVHVNDVVLESVEHSSRLASQSEVGINLTLYDAGSDRPEAIVRGDAELLRTVFDNLLRNAVQFSDRGSAISVDVGASGDQVTIAIRDRGPGAPPEHINRIFERFVQAPNQKPGRRGTGLGLAIARGIVELHNGSIAATNHPEGGCVFTVSLPLVSPHTGPPPLRRPLVAGR
jgi:signal transduction histidine kinase